METSGLDKKRIVWEHYGFSNLLVWLFIYLVVSPFLERFQWANIAMNLLLTMAMFSAVYAVNKEGRALPVAAVLLLISMGLLWLGHFGLIDLRSGWQSAALILYLGTLVYSFARYLLRKKRVNFNVICAALCLYLVIGLFWGSLFHLVQIISCDASFAGVLLDSADTRASQAHVFNYFSFVTMSTLGYGDILPQTSGAAVLCQAEAVFGQFFTVVLVARLVGIQVAQEVTSERED